jgi:hypothetical protein
MVGLALPSPWTESGLSFRSDRPHLVFIENEVDRVGLYGEMDATHMIGFQAVNNKVLFENSVVEKVLNFRNECQIHKRNLTLQGVGQFIFLGFAFYGGWKFF